ncbi:MAG: cobalt-precorrin hydrolase / cobalt-factor methyltransferase / precorrin-3B [Frankiaceae bacterium]|nr:cobalt-precorrin hydrolase / cobalt-factor methyltransferase / precorrin-3B [Frankiaceae bacterium]
MIGIVAATAAGKRMGAHLAETWPDTKVYDGPPRQALSDAWGECDGIVAFLAIGATVRLVAPLLTHKLSDPGLVCVDEAGRFAVAVLGGHGGGANALAERLGATLGVTPVVTTASDSVGAAALDQLGMTLAAGSAVAAVGAALLNDAPVDLGSDAPWPLPPLPGRIRETTVNEALPPCILVTDRLIMAPDPSVVLRPPSLVLGLGSSRNVDAGEVLALIDGTLLAAGLSAESVFAAATVEAKATEPGLVAACAQRGWPLVPYSAEDLDEIAVPHPSDVVRAAVGTSSVSEAAALRHAGAGAELVVGKTASAMATVAVARRRPRGRLAIVGLGPGARDLLTPRAAAALAGATVVVGLDQYVEQIRDLLRPGTRVVASARGDEEERARTAVDEARAGRSVALVSSGDAGVYAMASPALETAGDDVDVQIVPGVTAAVAAAALLGSPLGHDHAAVSLSDLLTPWEIIEQRIAAVAAGDFVVTFYNPRSRGREWQLPRALEILRDHRPASTPVGLVRDASRAGERVVLTTLAEVDPGLVDMRTAVVVGNSQTRMVAGRMVTPRGYRWG